MGICCGRATDLDEVSRMKLLKLKKYKALNYPRFELAPQLKRTPEQSLEFIKNLEQGTFNSHSYGCLLGAFVGDSLGSYLEFDSQPASLERLEACMEMPGGGVHNITPG